MADCMSQRISRASALSSEDSDSISFYPATQAGIKIIMIANDIDGTSNKPFQELLGIHQQEGVGSLCIHKHINITTLMVFTTGNRAKKTKRLNSIVVPKCIAATLQDVDVIGLAHKPFLFLVAKIDIFFKQSKYLGQKMQIIKFRI